jgi:hypothetical protein
MTTTKTFHIGDVLTAMTGRLVSPRHIEGVYDILNWMTGDSLFTHQLPRASREAEPVLRERFPDLAAIEIPEWGEKGTKEVIYAWLDEQVAIHGETREVAPLDASDHPVIDPLTEFAMIRPGVPIIPVVVDGD